MSTPLFDKIAEHIGRENVGFHTPGHQRGHGCSREFNEKIRKYLFEMDLTELAGLDNLKDPTGCIKEAQALAAQNFAAKQTFFLVNGSTVGLQAAILAVNKSRGKVIVSRQAHLSILNAFVLSGGMPLIAPVTVDSEWGIPLGTTPKDLLSTIEANRDAQAVVLTQPSYQGTACDFPQLKEIVTEKGLPLIVDEAHGAHLYFQERMPISAQKHQADVVIQSTHKTLSALTQASMLHVNTERWIAPVQRALEILQTTSPSYLLLASLDCAQAQMGKEGSLLVERALELAAELRRNIKNIPGYRIFGEEFKAPWYQDPTKIVISAAEFGLSGWELASILRKNYGIEVELSEYYYILILLTIGHSRADITRISKALRQIAGHQGDRRRLPPGKPEAVYEDEIKLCLTPREVFRAEVERIPLTKSKGRIAGEPLTVYPPGIPLVWAGQLLEPERMKYLLRAQSEGLKIQGLFAGGLVTVVKES